MEWLGETYEVSITGFTCTCYQNVLRHCTQDSYFCPPKQTLHRIKPSTSDNEEMV